jgi:hypothetical protein
LYERLPRSNEIECAPEDSDAAGGWSEGASCCELEFIGIDAVSAYRPYSCSMVVVSCQCHHETLDMDLTIDFRSSLLRPTIAQHTSDAQRLTIAAADIPSENERYIFLIAPFFQIDPAISDRIVHFRPSIGIIFNELHNLLEKYSPLNDLEVTVK